MNRSRAALAWLAGLLAVTGLLVGTGRAAAGPPPASVVAAPSSYAPDAAAAAVPDPLDAAAPAGLSWPRARFAPCGALDPQRRDWYVVGGRSEGAVQHFRDAWVLELAGRGLPRWHEVAGSDAPGGPPPLRSCAAAWDAARDRLLVFGGWDGVTPRSAVWALDRAGAWTTLCDATSCGTGPAPRRAATATYDPARQRLLVMGGVDSAYRNDVWSLSLSGTPAWTRLEPSGALPPVRGSHAAVHDPVRDRLWVVGGTQPGTDLGDVWSLDLATLAWTQRVPASAGPPQRSGAGLVHDAAADQLVYWGGWNSDDGTYPAELSVLRGLGSAAPAWATVPVGTETAEGRAFGSTVWDAATRRLLVTAGGPTGDPRKDTVAVRLPGPHDPRSAVAAWAGVAPLAPVTARDQVAVHRQPGAGAVLAFGGFGSGTLPGDVDTGAHLADTWRYDASASTVKAAWTNATPAGSRATLPLDREATAYASDTRRGRLLLFGGLHGDRSLADTWAASVDRSGRTVWRQLCSPTSCGAAPPARWGGHAVYDPLGDRLVVVAGRTSSGATFADAWALPLSGPTRTWTQLAPAGTPPPSRWGGAVGYDALRYRLVLTGGQAGSDGGAVPYADAWELTLGPAPAWRQLQPSGAPPAPRRSAAYAMRSGLQPALLVATGYTATTGVHHNDAWALRLDSADGAWEQVVADDCASTGAPSCRRSASAVHDPRTDRLVVLFGRDAGGFFADPWAVDLRARAWTPLPGAPVATAAGSP